ncbi:MAG: hypothetical protein E7564_03540 [Ruminococcaceae bacterium]|nr:hypothetical protein [Oscillospiraceae bacterium]
MNASVKIPEVSRVDIVEALPRIYSEEEISGFIKRHNDEIGWYTMQAVEPYSGQMPSIDEKIENYEGYQLWLSNIPFEMRYSHNLNAITAIKEKLPEEVRDNYVRMSLIISYGLSKQSGEIMFPPGFKFVRSNELADCDEVIPLTEEKANDCTISMEKAIEIADDEVKALASDYVLSEFGQNRKYEEFNNPQYYLFRYTQQIGGVSVNNSYGMEQCDIEYGYTSGQSVVTVTVNDDGVCALEYEAPTDVGEVVQKDVELLSFNDIWEIFKKISVLSIQSYEMYEEITQNELEVYDIRFGYMSVLQGDGTYQYTPVWDFYARRILKGSGAYEGSNNIPPIEGKSCLTINAVNGTIIDRDLGY